MIKRKIITTLLTAVLLLSVLITVAPVAQAAGAYTISLAGTDGNNVISARPGDTVTLILSAENNPGITGIGVNISYPKELSIASHELPADAASKMKTEGKFTPNIITTAGSSFVFYMNQATGTTEKKLVTYNGTLYQLTFKIATDATAGDYKINLAARDGTNLTSEVDGSGYIIPTSVEYVSNITMAGCTIQVETGCTNHSFGSWKDAGNGKHSRTCSACGATESADHAWNSGTVTQNPSCGEVGVKTYTCTTQDCGATKTENIDKTNNHSFSAWKDAGNGKHCRTCSVCKMAETEDHIWDSGTVTKNPSCGEVGVKTYACTTQDCGATKTENIDKTNNHSFSAWKDAGNGKHSRNCSVCKQTESADHVWNDGTVTKNPTCNEEGSKTYRCTQCNATKVEVIAKGNDHTYDNTCDPDCNVCGQTHSVTHRYDASWRMNKKDHWYQCTVCGDKKDVAAHVPGPAATVGVAQTCTVCDYEVAPALEPTEPSENVTEGTTDGTTEGTTEGMTEGITEGTSEGTIEESKEETTVPSTSYEDPEGPKNQILLITLLAVIVAAAAAVVILLFVRKKNRPML